MTGAGWTAERGISFEWLRGVTAILGICIAVSVEGGCSYSATPAPFGSSSSAVSTGHLVYTFNPLSPKLGVSFPNYPAPIMGTTYLGKPGQNDPQFRDLSRLMRDHAFFQWDLYWANTETASGAYDWTALDARIDDASNHAGNLLVTLRGWNPVHGGVRHDVGPWLDDFVHFARDVAQHVQDKDNVQFEIWSAPDAPATKLTAAAFAQMVSRTSIAIKAINPNALVFSGAATNLDPAWLSAVLAQFAANAKPNIDGFGVDPGDTGTPEDADATLLAAQSEVHSALGVPIVVSHWAFPSDNKVLSSTGNDRSSGNHAASFLARQWLTLWRVGVPRGLLYPSQGRGISFYGLDGRDEWSFTRAQDVFGLYAGGDGAVLAGELADVPGGWRIAWKKTCFIDTFFLWNPSFDAPPLTIRVPVGTVYINNSDRASVKTVTRVELSYDEVDGYYVFRIPNDNTPTILASANKGGCS